MKNPAVEGGARLGREFLDKSQSNSSPTPFPAQVCYFRAAHESLTVSQRLTRHLYDLGERSVSEFLAELGREHGIEEDILRRLRTYARLDLGVVRAVGGDKFPPTPLMVIDGRRR